MVFIPFGVLLVGGAVNLATGHAHNTLVPGILGEVVVIGFLGLNSYGRGVVKGLGRYLMARRARVGLVVVVVGLVAIWLFVESAKTANVEAPAKNDLARAMATLVRNDSSWQIKSNPQVVEVLKRAGIASAAGIASTDQIGVSVVAGGNQIRLVYDIKATSACIAEVVTSPAMVSPGANSPTNMAIAYGEWADNQCNSAKLPSEGAYQGTMGVSWTGSRSDWMRGY